LIGSRTGEDGIACDALHDAFHSKPPDDMQEVVQPPADHVKKETLEQESDADDIPF